MEKVAIRIVVYYNEEEVHATKDAVIDKDLANQTKKLITKQVDGMISTLTTAQNMHR